MLHLMLQKRGGAPSASLFSYTSPLRPPDRPEVSPYPPRGGSRGVSLSCRLSRGLHLRERGGPPRVTAPLQTAGRAGRVGSRDGPGRRRRRRRPGRCGPLSGYAVGQRGLTAHGLAEHAPHHVPLLLSHQLLSPPPSSSLVSPSCTRATWLPPEDGPWTDSVSRGELAAILGAACGCPAGRQVRPSPHAPPRPSLTHTNARHAGPRPVSSRGTGAALAAPT